MTTVLRGKQLQYSIALLTGMGFLLFGYDQGVMGGLLTLPSFVETFTEMDVNNTTGDVLRRNTETQGITVAIYEIGCAAGALSTLTLGDKWGRRKILFLGGFIVTLGAILHCASFGLPQLIVGRIVTGYGMGFITATVPIFQAECSSAKARGPMVAILGSLIAAGIALSYWIDFAFFFIDSSASWRAPIAIQMVFSISICLFVYRLPESPRWLVKVGRISEAASVLGALQNVTTDDPVVASQIADIQESLAKVDSSIGLKQVIRMGKEKNIWRCSLGMWSQCMQQITGINLITFYAAFIYQSSLGLSALDSRILAACTGTEYFLASGIAVITIERYGRRPLMLFGALGQSITMVLLTITAYLATPLDGLPFPGQANNRAGIGAVALFFVFNSIFAIGWLGSPWLYPSEINPLSTRAPSNGLSTATNWVFNFIVVLITPIAFNQIGFYTYTIFAVINLLMFPVVYYLYPETAGRTLEEIDQIFEEADPWKPWGVVKIAAEMTYHGDDLKQRKNASPSVLEKNVEDDRATVVEHALLKKEISHEEDVAKL